MSPQPKINFSQWVQPWVRGPHPGEDLRHVAEVAFDGLLPDFLASCCQDSNADAVCEELEVGDGVVDGAEVGGEREPVAELEPLAPRGATGAGATGANAVTLRPEDSAPMIARLACDVSRQSRQERFCGKCVWKKERSAESERSQRREA